jgi:acyl dehydratase
MEHAHPDLLLRGFRYEVHKRVTETDVYLWSGLVGDCYPVHNTTAFARQTAVERPIAQHAYIAGLIVATTAHVSAHISSSGAILERLTMHFSGPVMVGTTLAVTVTVTDWDSAAGLYWLDIRATRADGTPAVLGTAGLRPHTARLVAA